MIEQFKADIDAILHGGEVSIDMPKGYTKGESVTHLYMRHMENMVNACRACSGKAEEICVCVSCAPLNKRRLCGECSKIASAYLEPIEIALEVCRVEAYIKTGVKP